MLLLKSEYAKNILANSKVARNSAAKNGFSLYYPLKSFYLLKSR